MLTVITGPMFSGKSSKLIAMCTANLIAGKSVKVLKPENDIRYNKDYIVSHTMEKFAATRVPLDVPATIATSMIDYDVIAFDEVQFFRAKEIISMIEHILYEQKKNIICAGLSNDFDGVPFGAMPHLLSIADKIISLKAVCTSCKEINTATRTYRKNNDMTQTVVGGSEIYEPRCFRCWI